MPVRFTSLGIDFKLEREKKIRDWLKQVCVKEKKLLGEINYIFVDQERIKEINSKFLNHYFTTDVISFDNSYLNELSGDIYICTDIVRDNSIDYSKGNFSKELLRVIVHGLLHLAGYRDDDKSERKRMRSKEDIYLKYLDRL